ncbi:recombinase family protein [Cellulomonas sp. P5_C5]
MTSSTSTPTRAAVYLRVSSEEQVEGTSLTTQEERCRAYIDAQGWQLAEVYADEGVSGAKASRPALDRLLADCAAGRVQAVVVLKADRFSRNLGHLLTTLDQLTAQGVTFRSVTEAIDTGSTSGRAMTGMLGVFAQMERDLIRERTRSGVNAKVRAGGWGGGQEPPYGYRIAGSGRDAKLAVDDREAALVRQALEMILDQQLSALQTAVRLNALGMTPRHATAWTSQNLRQFLRRGEWDGRWTFGKTGTSSERITVPVEPIVSPQRFAQLQAYLAGTAQTRGAAQTHPLSGRMRCTCGAVMTGIARGDRANRRYRCSHGRTDPRRDFRCLEPSLLGQRVDDAVWGQVLDLLTDPDRLMAMARERLGMLTGAQQVTAEAMTDADAAVQRTQAALAGAVAQCLSMGLDQATTEATVQNMRAKHTAALEHRATVAAISQETAQAKARMVTAQQLARVARDRLVTADSALRAQVLGLLNVQVQVEANDADGVHLVVTGSVAHDLMLQGLAPAELATDAA